MPYRAAQGDWARTDATVAARYFRFYGRAINSAATFITKGILNNAGQVYITAFGAAAASSSPFGGFKASGYGREKGHEALDQYVGTTTVFGRID